MATQRTKAELLAFFVEGVENITPSMVRDFVESCTPSTGGLHFADPGTTTVIATPSTFVKAANVSTLHDAYRFSQPQNNRLQYDGVASVNAVFIATLSFTCASNNQVLEFAFAINGVVQTASRQTAKIATGTDIQAVTIMTHPILATGDYAEIWVSNLTSASNITVEHGHVHVQAFLN